MGVDSLLPRGPDDWTQVTMPEWQVPKPAEASHWPKFLIFK